MASRVHGQHLLAPRPADAERARRIEARYSAKRGRAPAAERALVGPVAAVVDRARARAGWPLLIAHRPCGGRPRRGRRGGSTGRAAAGRGRRRRRGRCRAPRRRRAPSPLISRLASSRTVAARPAASQRVDEPVVRAPPTSTRTVPARSSSCVGRAGQHELAGVDHHDVVAHRLHVVEQVGGQHDRDAERRQAGDEGEHLLPADRVEARGRLVEQHQLGIGHERLGQLRALAHAGREALDRAEPGLVETDEVEHVGGPLAGGPQAAARSSRRTWRPGRPRSGRVARQSCSGMNPRRLRTPIGSSATGWPHTSTRPVGRADQAEQQAEQRRLAGAVGPDQPDRAAGHRDRQLAASATAPPGKTLVSASVRKAGELASIRCQCASGCRLTRHGPAPAVSRRRTSARGRDRSAHAHDGRRAA